MAYEPHSCAEEGFSLIEVLCAFVILSISAAIVLQTVQLAAKSSMAAEERMRILAAVPKIELAIWAADGEAAPQHGETDGLHWELQPIALAAEEVGSRISRLRVFQDGRAHYYDFLIDHREKQP